MKIYQNLGKFLDNYGSPFFIGSLLEKKVLYVNEIAKKMFACTEETCDFEKIFQKTEERMESLIAKGLKEGKNTLLYNFTAITGAQEKIVVDLQFGFFNEEKTEMFLELIPQNDTRLQMAQHQIHHSPRAEAILNLDEKLSIVDCNEAFHKVFESSEQLRYLHFKNDLVNGFLPEIRENLIADIHKSMSLGEIFSTELKVFTAVGEEKWYRFDLQKRELDQTGTKLMCYMVNIEKEVKRKEENALLNQYLSIMQEKSKDILYRVDVIENTMYHYSDFIQLGGSERAIVDYVNVFISGEMIHPEDKDTYLQSFKDFYEKDIAPEAPIRFSFDGEAYHWYRIAGKKIYNTQGDLVEVFGALIDVDKEVTMEAEVYNVHNYFEAFQTVTDESFCVINLKEKTLTQKGTVAKELGITHVLEHFPDCAYTFIHPDDLSNFKAFTEESVLGDTIRVQSRMKTVKGDYQWYELRSQGIKDKQGNITEIVGKINNIQGQKKMLEQVSYLNQYLEAAQSISGESLFYVDMKTRILRQKGDVAIELGIPEEIPNFPDGAYPFIWEEDLKKYQEFAKNALEGKDATIQVRVRTATGEYKWYEIITMMIYDQFGLKKELFGRMSNIQKTKTMQAEVSTLQKYFDVLQEFTDDIIYRIDVPTQTLYHAYQSERTLKLGLVLPNYLETVINEKIVHPDDADIYLQNSKEWLVNDNIDCEVRMCLVKDEYEWYSIKRRKVFDEDGTLVEVVGALVNIQKEREIQADYSELSQFFTAMEEMDNDVVFRIDLPTMTLSFKRQISPEKWEDVEIPDFLEGFKRGNQVHPEDRECYFKLADGYFGGMGSDSYFRCEVRFALVSTEYIWYNMKCKKIYNKEGIPTEVYGKMLNIDVEKAITKGYSHLNQYFTAMQDLSEDILFHIDIDTMTFHHNDVNAKNVGLSYDIPDFVNTLIDKNIIHPDCHESYRKDIAAMLSEEKMEYQVLSLSKPDVYEWFNVQGRFIRNEQGKPVELFGKMQNIQAQRNLEERASHDMMTGALNKATFEEKCKNSFVTSELEDKYALIFIDLDDFKGVNDTLGHSYGDALLTTVGQRLKRTVRGDDLVGRIGGDEFAVLLRHIENEESVMSQANLMLEALQKDFSFEEKVIGIKASVGVALYPYHGKIYKDLISNADMAVYESKRQGKNRVSMYSEKLEEY